mmetsp:Transcript_14679/g.22803  ORF Transcript_14679/g.22803 Transcript_14679/m.22803 type:complete len:207 (+) Transcript_14679:3325-3945(+)
MNLAASRVFCNPIDDRYRNVFLQCCQAASHPVEAHLKIIDLFDHAQRQVRIIELHLPHQVHLMRQIPELIGCHMCEQECYNQCQCQNHNVHSQAKAARFSLKPVVLVDSVLDSDEIIRVLRNDQYPVHPFQLVLSWAPPSVDVDHPVGNCSINTSRLDPNPSDHTSPISGDIRFQVRNIMPRGFPLHHLSSHIPEIGAVLCRIVSC